MHIDFLILNQHLYAETAALSYSCSVFDETFFIAPETKMGVSFRFLIPKLYLYMCMHQRFFFFFSPSFFKFASKNSTNTSGHFILQYLWKIALICKLLHCL